VPAVSGKSTTAGEVASAVGARLDGDPAVELSSATHDSRRVRPGGLFCCVRGASADGHDHAAAAVGAGALALLCDREPPGVDAGVTRLFVADVRAAMGPAAATVHHRPADRLDVVGVTGTNGKTTVVTMVAAVLGHAGRRTGVIGTLTGERTTPEAPELQERLAAFADDGMTHVAMEVSSHALAQHRVDGMTFAVGAFTNLGVDHLDFHGTREAYFAAKARLFEPGRCRRVVVNVDDVHGRLLRDAGGVEVVGVSLGDLDGLRLGPGGSTFRWRGRQVQLPVPGRHNVSNALVSAEVCVALGVDADAVAAGLAHVGVVPGRFEPVDAGQEFVVVVDYAHTPDALEQVLSTARELASPGGRVAVVFGCGGDRDHAKRPLMGEVAGRLADRVIVTTDNPRSEDAAVIAAQVVAGCSPAPDVEADRRLAIRAALSGAGAGDVVVIAGKGHEQGQVVGDTVTPFDDRVVAAEELAALTADGGTAGVSA
jgi:UDP-N-acetylmuramoyl-L-alanyl-D-glutamate--2,6-diaminopimelate ligase